MKRGQQMLNELQFYQLDLGNLGYESEDAEEADEDKEELKRKLLK